MKKLVTTLCTVAALAVVANVSFAANSVRVSQVYGGGGGGVSTPATYAQDYVELFNFSNAAVNIGGWSIEYGSATGNWGSSAANLFTFPPGALIQPCSYVLVALGSASLNPAVPPVPAPDYSNTTTNMSATGGKIGLFNATNSNLACGSELPGTLVDKVAYGTANCAEVTAVAALSTNSAGVRNGAGVTDTDNNVNDFTIVNNAVPHNSASPANVNCLAVPSMNSTWGQLKTIYR
jgi:hypothetical protein